MPKLEWDEVKSRLTDAEAELYKLLDDHFREPLRLGGARLPDECPRGHKYPADPARYNLNTRMAGCRKCLACRKMSVKRQKLREKIKNYKRLLREASW